MSGPTDNADRFTAMAEAIARAMEARGATTTCELIEKLNEENQK